MNSNKHFRMGKSTVFLILSNLTVIVFAVIAKWSILDVMVIYWAQSVVIGCFNWRRILDLKQFSTNKVDINGQPVLPMRRIQSESAWLFLFHYQFFHIGYLLFLINKKEPPSVMQCLGIVVCFLIFLINHQYSYWHNRQRDMSRKPNIENIMLFPYARVIPMHLTIVFGHFFAKDSSGELILFLGLKTLADVIMHKVEHSDARR
jgi:hypothetical protein